MTNTRRTQDIHSNYCDQDTISRGLQRKLEGLLAGFSIIHPLEVLEVFPQVEPIMLDREIAVPWLRLLQQKQRDLIDLNEDARHKFISNLVIGFQGGMHKSSLLRFMNSTYCAYEPVYIEVEHITWRGYDARTITADLVKRIYYQHNLRAGLPDLAEYLLEVLHR